MTAPQPQPRSTLLGLRSASKLLIAAGVDVYPEGRDAAALGALLARATDGELLVVAVHPEPLVVLPAELGWTAMRKQAEETPRQTRDEVARGARIVVETDWSVPRALALVVTREHRNLLIVGSSRHGPQGRIRIGKRTRQLLCHFRCALAVAPRGLAAAPERRLSLVGVGYDGSDESGEALALAGSIAAAAGAKPSVRGVVDDRLPGAGWLRLGRDQLMSIWWELTEPMVESLRERVQAAADATGADVVVEVRRGRPVDALIELGEQADLLVVGSRRWGAASRVLVGSTGEALLHDAACPVLVVPRPGAARG
jgi:nucleotide-binding universal stress UspA family protein